MAQDIPADKAQQVFFVDDDLIERLLRRDPTPPRQRNRNRGILPRITISPCLLNVRRNSKPQLRSLKPLCRLNPGAGRLRSAEDCASSG
jgi:hypothetical protein